MPGDVSPLQAVQIANKAQLHLVAINTAATLTLLTEFELMQAYASGDAFPEAYQQALQKAENTMQETLNNLWAQMGLLEALGPAPQMHLHAPSGIVEAQ